MRLQRHGERYRNESLTSEHNRIDDVQCGLQVKLVQPDHLRRYGDGIHLHLTGEHI